MSKLFEPIHLGSIQAPNRVLMAPLTRARATRDFVPTPIMAEYYSQRASAGLIISEATGISKQGLGWPNAPGIWNDEQVQAWKVITQAVHAKGGRIILQLWHMGALVHPDFLDGNPPVAASSYTAPSYAHTYEGKKDYLPSRELKLDEIPSLIEDYRRAATNALKAGFDGVQIHAANGYLIDSFLRDGTNKRTDAYGGSIQNRIRLLTEVAQAVVDVVGADRTSVRLSPNGIIQGCNDSAPHLLFPAAAKALNDLNVSFLELREPDFNGTFGKAEVPPIAPHIKAVFKNPLVLNCDYDLEKSVAHLESGVADAITFGRKFIANPDLPHRLKNHLPLNKDDMATWYSHGPEGYVDYPTASATTTA